MEAMDVYFFALGYALLVLCQAAEARRHRPRTRAGSKAAAEEASGKDKRCGLPTHELPPWQDGRAKENYQIDDAVLIATQLQNLITTCTAPGPLTGPGTSPRRERAAEGAYPAYFPKNIFISIISLPSHCH